MISNRLLEKIIKVIFGIAVIILPLSWFMLSFIEAMPRKADYLKSFNIVTPQEAEYVYSFSGIGEGAFISSLDGWIIKRGQPTNGIMLDVRLAVRNRDTGSFLVLPTEVRKREKTTKEMADGLDYAWSKINTEWLNLLLPANEINENYDFYACYTVNGYTELVPIEIGDVNK